MLKFLLCLLLIPSSLFAVGNLPWVGVSFGRPDAERLVALGLEGCVGLQVREVAKGGPLSQSGGKKGDLWWKFDDQILVSRGQLVVLLRAKKPGDSVKLEFYRSGKLKKIFIKLAKWPHSKSFLIPSRGGNHTHAARTRRLKSSVVTAELTVKGENFMLKKIPSGWNFVVKKESKVLFDKELRVSGISSLLEPRWMEPFMILQMTLAQKSGSGSDQNGRRLRYIPRETK